MDGSSVSETLFNFESPKPLLVPIVKASSIRITINLDKGGNVI